MAESKWDADRVIGWLKPTEELVAECRGVIASVSRNDKQAIGRVLTEPGTTLYALQRNQCLRIGLAP